jgi:hypothetical protein
MDGWLIKPSGWEDIEYESIKEGKYENNDNLLSQYDGIDYIFVLAGGLNDQSENHDWVIRRLDIAVALYQRKPRKIICLGGGTYHKVPHLNHQGFVIHESTACAQYLILQGIPHQNIMREWGSYDTIANGVFAFFNYIIPLSIKKCAIITSDFHIERTMVIFNWINNLKGIQSPIQMEFISVDSNTLYQAIINARIEREKQSLKNLLEVVNKITSIEEFHEWFYTQHNAYNCAYIYKREEIPSTVTASY